ncbi:MAG TPA: PEGA domain-containing protein [Verrucomicrobiae bacterium]|nr:PEGA domain-containing protein [Verrucomicrobiae bacterium]
MRNHLAVIVSGMLVWTSILSESVIASWGQEAAGSPSSAQTRPATGNSTQELGSVKPIAACGFCLPDGTKVPLVLGRELSSGKESAGNRVDFEVTEDVKVKDAVVIPKGSLAMGTIVEAQARRRLGRAGKLDVRIEEVRLADGSRARLRAMQESKGKGRQGLMTGAMIATGVLFFPAAPVFLFMRGKDVVIAKGTPVASYIDGDTQLDAAKFQIPAKPVETPPAPTSPTEPSIKPETTGPPPPQK